MKKSLNFRSSSHWREHQINVWTFIIIALVGCIAIVASVANAEEPTQGIDSAKGVSINDARPTLPPSLSDSLVKTKSEPLTKSLAPKGNSTTEMAGQLFKGLIFALAVFFAGVSLYRRFVIAPKELLGGGIEVIARRSLGPKTTLLVVRTEGQKYFLAQAGDGVSLLSEIEDPNSFERTFPEFHVEPPASEPKVALAMERR